MPWLSIVARAGILHVVRHTGIITAMAVAILGWLACSIRVDDAASHLPLQVDASLSPDGARGLTEGWPFVRSEQGKGGAMVLTVCDTAPGDMSQKVEMTLSLGQASAHAAVRLTWYGDDFHNRAEESASDLQGTVTIDADRPPSRGDERIVAYDLRAMRDGQPVELRGKVRIPFVVGPR